MPHPRNRPACSTGFSRYRRATSTLSTCSQARGEIAYTIFDTTERLDKTRRRKCGHPRVTRVRLLDKRITKIAAFCTKRRRSLHKFKGVY